MKYEPIDVSAVIPAYNEAARIKDTLSAVQEYVDEIIVVDDASTDNTASLAASRGARVLQQTENRGYIAAIKLGFQHARGRYVVTLDADGECSPHTIPQLLGPLVRGDADMVQGRRNLAPRPSERLLSRLAGLKAPVGDSGTGLRALRTELARKLEIKGACICGVLALEVIAKGGRIQEVPITLTPVDKPRRIAWFHLQQFLYLLPWLIKPMRSN